MEFFDRTGNATCYSADGEHLYLWNGEPASYVYEGRIYSFRGKVLGWIENGWLYDRRNKPALFSADAEGGPVKPVRKVKPVKGVRRVRPVKSVRQVAPVRPVRTLTWSECADALYFRQ
jgi:hypothetical protein